MGELVCTVSCAMVVYDRHVVGGCKNAAKQHTLRVYVMYVQTQMCMRQHCVLLCVHMVARRACVCMHGCVCLCTRGCFDECVRVMCEFISVWMCHHALVCVYGACALCGT